MSHVLSEHDRMIAGMVKECYVVALDLTARPPVCRACLAMPGPPRITAITSSAGSQLQHCAADWLGGYQGRRRPLRIALWR